MSQSSQENRFTRIALVYIRKLTTSEERENSIHATISRSSAMLSVLDGGCTVVAIAVLAALEESGAREESLVPMFETTSYGRWHLNIDTLIIQAC